MAMGNALATSSPVMARNAGIAADGRHFDIILAQLRHLRGLLHDNGNDVRAVANRLFGEEPQEAATADEQKASDTTFAQIRDVFEAIFSELTLSRHEINRLLEL